MKDALQISEVAQLTSERILSVGVKGLGPMKGSIQIAEEHLAHHGDVEKAIDRLIATHVRLAGSTGFVTGLGGAITMPLTIPTDLATLWVLQGRLVGAIAHLRGYDINSDEVRSLVFITMLGSSGAEALSSAGIKLGNKGAAAAIKKVSGETLKVINQKVGFRLVTKAGTTGVVNLTKFVPLAGGVVGGGVNVVSTKGVAAWGKRNFPVLEPAA